MTIDSRLTEIPRLAQWVDEQLRGSGLGDDLVFDIHVCLEEAIANIVLHSFKGEAGHPLEIHMELGADSARFDICDSGPPFDPREAAEPAAPASLADAAIGGTGIRLIRGLSRSLDYVRLDNANRLTLTFAPRTGS